MYTYIRKRYGGGGGSAVVVVVLHDMENIILL